MPGQATRKIALFSLLFSGCLSCSRADDLTAADGTVFKDAQVIRYETDGVVIRHAGGTNRVDWKSLPAAVRGRYQAEARKQKEDEIQKLKRDLARAEAEAARLKPDDGKSENPKRTQAAKSGDAAVGPLSGPSTTRPVSDLPALRPDEVVEVADLVQQFKDDPAGAEQRYRKRKFRLNRSEEHTSELQSRLHL